VSAQVETEATHDKVNNKTPDSTVVALPQLPLYSLSVLFTTSYHLSGCPRRGRLYGLRLYEFTNDEFLEEHVETAKALKYNEILLSFMQNVQGFRWF